MKIDSNRSPVALTKISARVDQAAEPSADSVVGNFADSTKLNDKLADVPDVRPDEVARARALISDQNYPDGKIIRDVARRLVDEI